MTARALGASRVEITPTPTDEEIAAIVATVEALWPKAAYLDSTPVVRVPTWRFSNRWWIAPLPKRRERPRR